MELLLGQYYDMVHLLNRVAIGTGVWTLMDITRSLKLLQTDATVDYPKINSI